jgi:hypothetical protein
MVPGWDYTAKHDFEPSCLFADFFFLDLRMSIVNPFVTRPHHWERLSDHYAETLQVVLLFGTLPLHCFERVFPRSFAGSPFLPTLIQSEGTMIAALLSIVFDGLFYVITSWKPISHLIHWIRLVHLMPS